MLSQLLSLHAFTKYMLPAHLTAETLKICQNQKGANKTKKTICFKRNIQNTPHFEFRKKVLYYVYALLCLINSSHHEEIFYTMTFGFLKSYSKQVIHLSTVMVSFRLLMQMLPVYQCI